MEASSTRLDVDSDNYHVILLSPTHTSAKPSFRSSHVFSRFGTVDERRGVADVWVGDNICQWLPVNKQKCEIMLQNFWSFLIYLWS